MQLTYAETKRLLLSTVDPSPTPATAGVTVTGGRLNVGAAMQALSLLLRQRGLPVLPGAPLEGPTATALARRLQENPWGRQLLLQPGAGAAAAGGAGLGKKTIKGKKVAAASAEPDAGENWRADEAQAPTLAPANAPADADADASAGAGAEAGSRLDSAAVVAVQLQPRPHRRLKAARPS